jgi:hypothetical protein
VAGAEVRRAGYGNDGGLIGAALLAAAADPALRP